MAKPLEETFSAQELDNAYAFIIASTGFYEDEAAWIREIRLSFGNAVNPNILTEIKYSRERADGKEGSFAPDGNVTGTCDELLPNSKPIASLAITEANNGDE